MSAPDLLPCPFCGDDKVASFARTCDRHTPYNPADRTYPVVRCSCGVEVPGANWSEPETAIATWNKRAPTAPQGAEPRELTDQQIIALACAVADELDATRVSEMFEGKWLARTTFEDSALVRFARMILAAAPQGAEIAREPTAAMIVEGTKELAHVIANDVTGKARHIWYAMHDAALTPTDAETKG